MKGRVWLGIVLAGVLVMGLAAVVAGQGSGDE